jgi:hypothetical protein
VSRAFSSIPAQREGWRSIGTKKGLSFQVAGHKMPSYGKTC